MNDQKLADWQGRRLKADELKRVTIQLTQQNVFHASDGPHDGIGTLLRLREEDGDDSMFASPLDTKTERVVGRLDEILKRHAGERDMSKVTREWRVIHNMPEDDPEMPVRQVYAWLLTSDRQMVVVSKDGEKWQLPGGKPDGDENALQAAVREIYEETGLDVERYRDQINFFGEYSLEDHDTVVHPPRYRQVRVWVQLNETASALKLSTAGEAAGQNPEDAVRFVRTVPVKDILELIPWLENTDEYKALKRNKIIDRPEISA